MSKSLLFANNPVYRVSGSLGSAWLSLKPNAWLFGAELMADSLVCLPAYPSTFRPRVTTVRITRYRCPDHLLPVRMAPDRAC